MIFGLLNVNKPTGPTSHDIVAGIRRGTGEKRIGHAGTLDPLASGVLVVALGQATRLVEYLQASQKTYRAEVTIGIQTDSYDAEGAITATYAGQITLTEGDIDRVLDQFRGLIKQTPPVYSAIKVRGKSAHQRVRAGETIELQPRSIMIHEVNIEAYNPPILTLRIVCSPGTYIRSLAHDLGQTLQCGAMLSSLTRISSGSFKLEDAVEWETLQAAFQDNTWMRYLIPADRALDSVPIITTNADEVRRISNGMPLQRDRVSDGLARACTADGLFIAVLEGKEASGVWKPSKVFPDVIEYWKAKQGEK